MTENCRIITEEEYQEYMKLKEQVESANQLAEDLELADDIRISMKANEYLRKWGLK